MQWYSQLKAWTKYDTDSNGYLDKDQAKPYIDHVAKIIEAERAKNYQQYKFEAAECVLFVWPRVWKRALVGAESTQRTTFMTNPASFR